MYLRCVVIERWILLYTLLLITKCVYKRWNVKNFKKTYAVMLFLVSDISLCWYCTLDEHLGSYLQCRVVGFLYWQWRRVDVIYFTKFIALAQLPAVHVCWLLKKYMFVCIYVYIYIHTYTLTYIHRYTHTYIHTYIHTHVHTCMVTIKKICLYVYMYIYTHTYIHTYIHTHIHIHTYIHTYTRTYMYGDY